MSNQKHDIGNKKRRHAEARQASSHEITTQAMAHSLIERGLATTRILDANGTPNRRRQRP
ncbi:hypothetical protein GU243_06115 [Pseudarthrobacter psychrotolerans]|uniref:Uncharacterized protein n=1 Tax=Pseudarthrobacter psychrotolerans TaxID=2697569 RepID=A0A6P1NKQ6_9MICC|nr:hypothetical protein [Pseudarthrobacter psychrotolerans]QHK19387.1 hypothetical protein GU243_06115 [Pseudarthrobacter psychrotolerans]